MSAKDAGLRIRVEKALRAEFLEACRSQDRSAAQVLREFMRGYIARYSDEIKQMSDIRSKDIVTRRN